MPFNVKIIDKKTVTEMGPNGEYTYTLLVTDYQGKQAERKIFPTTIKKYPNLEAELAAIQPGMTVGVETQPNGKYKEISQLTVGATPSTAVKTANKSTQSYDNVGAQVGNALTNACHSLGEKKVTVAEIETRAWELILLGERLKTRLANGEHQKTNEPPPYDPATQNPGYTENDVPF